MFRFITAAIASTVVSVSAFALPIHDIDPGDSYYLSLLGENELVSVARVDPTNNRVKIRRKSGYTQWVSPSRLLSYGSSFEEDAATAIIGVAVVACLFMPEECRQATQTSSSTSSASSARKSYSTKRIAVKNECREDVDIRVLRHHNSKWRNEYDRVWTVPANTTYNLSIGNEQTHMLTDSPDIYINAKSRSFYWDGKDSYKYGAKQYRFRKASVSDDGYRYRITMSCD